MDKKTILDQLNKYLDALRRIKPDIYDRVKSCVDRLDLECIMDVINEVTGSKHVHVKPQYGYDYYDLVYVYPVNHKVSFKYVAERYIEALEQMGVIVRRVDEFNVNSRYDRPVLLHTIMNVFFNNRFIPKAPVVGGFEVIETSCISDITVHVMNKLDLIIVPSNYSKNIAVKCGVEKPVEVVQHCIGLNWARPPKPISMLRDEIKQLHIKRKRNTIYVLFNIWHSGARKGADIFFLALNRLQSEYDNVVVVLKRKDILDPYLGLLKHLNHIEIAADLTEDEMIDLYDAVDMVVLTSRAGGFEMVGLEALARGKIVVVPDAGCFKEYSKYAVTYKAYNRSIAYPQPNPVHTGHGWEPSAYDLYEKLVDIVENIDDYRHRFMEQRLDVLNNFSCIRVGRKLYNILKRYKFIG